MTSLFYYPDNHGVTIGPVDCNDDQIRFLFNEWGPGEYLIQDDNPLLCRKGYLKELEAAECS
jgi:hypothetical protein